MQAQADGHSAEHKAAAVQARVADLEAQVISMRDALQEAEQNADKTKSELSIRERRLGEDERRFVREKERQRMQMDNEVRLAALTVTLALAPTVTLALGLNVSPNPNPTPTRTPPRNHTIPAPLGEEARSQP